ncbi:hypothetical protein Pcinc_007317 [Petrolisthes cinctipes]|uniref:Uncharacterized protein n=1 Tax=Petrolisthes cinctipes TaxID=88211 RepID=A0AAE1KWZ5_PETCI|nr:hypothetical protein Pcinc_007317 [Petrolisthes cinctipes]
MLLRLTDASAKQDVFRNIRNLHSKQAYKGVRVANDSTNKERDHELVLLKKAKNLQEKGESCHKVIGPPWWRRVVKVTEDRQGRVQQAGDGVKEEIGRTPGVEGAAQREEATVIM